MKLDIHLMGRYCGVLSIEEERFRFRYLDTYRRDGGPPLSLSMPVAESVFGDAVAFPFFENLLPEGDIRDLLAQRLKTASNNFARLLERTGGEVAGAVSLTASGRESAARYVPPSSPLDAVTLGKVLERIETAPFLANGGSAMRLSLAGAQNKLPVLIEDEAIRLPGSGPSSHIIKPPSRRFPGLVENEYLCMRAAAQSGLKVPPVELVAFRNRLGEEHYALQLQRYDRIQTTTGVERLHQEDLCQVLCVPSARKYTQDGGPGFQALFETARRHARPPTTALRELLRRVLFNLLIGNCDAHAKNFSFLHTATGIQLAPAYDLLCTRAWSEISQSLPMPVGSATTIGELDSEVLNGFGREVGINLIRQQKSLLRFVDAAYAALMDASGAVLDECDRDERVVVRRQVELADQHYRLLKSALCFNS